jgi:hypothetical protein
MTSSPQDPYVSNLVRELERIVNGMTYKVPELDRDHKAKAQAEGTWRVVSLSDRPKLGWVRSGIAYDPKTDSYFVACHASVGVPPRRFRLFEPALEFARTGISSGGEAVVVVSTATRSRLAGAFPPATAREVASSGERPSPLSQAPAVGSPREREIDTFAKATVDEARGGAGRSR